MLSGARRPIMRCQEISMKAFLNKLWQLFVEGWNKQLEAQIRFHK